MGRSTVSLYENPRFKLISAFVYTTLLLLNCVCLYVYLPNYRHVSQRQNWARVCLGAINENELIANTTHPIYPFGAHQPIPHFVTICGAGQDHCLTFSSLEWCSLLQSLGEYSHP